MTWLDTETSVTLFTAKYRWEHNILNLKTRDSANNGTLQVTLKVSTSTLQGQ